MGRMAAIWVAALLAQANDTDDASSSKKADGYRGIWYSNQPTGDAYRFKYSGGFATYPQQHAPIAIYEKSADKTFFCYGGRPAERNQLQIMASYYDHKTGLVPKPTIVESKNTDDAHDNATLSLDGQGHVWIFSNAHGTSRKATIWRSRQPYSVEAFEPVVETNFSYCQPWYLPGQGLVALHTRYSPGRFLFSMTSLDGRQWDEPRPLARIAQGHYQISTSDGKRLATAFNYHPAEGGLNKRTNLYYVQSDDGGRSWQDAGGEPITTPLTEVPNPALVRDFETEGRLVYLKDIQLDDQGRPIVLFLTSRGFEPGPANGLRVWQTARWDGQSWRIRPVTTSDHNYDYGSLYLEPGGQWTLIAPTDPGPQPWGTGGEVVAWRSHDEGKSWLRAKVLTHDSTHNHTYVRRPLNAHPDFYALWADGSPLEPSPSRLYFTNQAGDHVWRLPESMPQSMARPEVVD